MSLFKRKKEVKSEPGKLPNLPPSKDLPELPTLPELPKIEKRDHEMLPSFPDSKIGDDFSQQAVKSAVRDNQPSFEPMILPNNFKKSEKRTVELAESMTKSPDINRITMSLPENEEERHEVLKETRVKSVEPVYIRIDKFKLAIQSFNEIKNRVAEIENLLIKIKEQKQKEDEELREWEKEIETVKIRLEGIDRNIFSRVD